MFHIGSIKYTSIEMRKNMFIIIIIIILGIWFYISTNSSNSSNSSSYNSSNSFNTNSSKNNTSYSSSSTNTTKNTTPTSSQGKTIPHSNFTYISCPQCNTKNYVNEMGNPVCSSCRCNLKSPRIKNKIIRLTGVTYEGRQGIISKLRPHDQITISRDRNNKYDKNAIGIYNNQNQNIGWIPRDIASTLLHPKWIQGFS
jgi:hypothetical protein